MIQAPCARGKARSVTFLVALATAVAVVVACSPSQRANGEACIKDSDCLSGACVDAYCAAGPTLLDAQVNGDGGSADGTAGGDGTTGDTGSAAEAALPEGAAESGGGGDTGAVETGATDSGSSDSAAE